MKNLSSWKERRKDASVSMPACAWRTPVYVVKKSRQYCYLRRPGLFYVCACYACYNTKLTN